MRRYGSVVLLKDRIDLILESRGWSARAYARESGVGHSYIALLHKGKRGARGPSTAILEKLSKAAGVDVEWLRTGKGEPGGGLILPGCPPPEGSEPYPNRAQALALLKGLAAPQVEEALRQEKPSKGDLSLEKWLERARELQKIFEALERDLGKK